MSSPQLLRQQQQVGISRTALEIVGANGQGETIEACHQNLAAAIALILDDRQ